MNPSTQVTYRNLPGTPSLDEHVHDHVEHLRRRYGRITKCRVVVEGRHQHQKGHLFQVHVELHVPGGEVVVSREHGDEREHDDVYLALRDAFEATARRLDGQVRRRRHEVKAHSVGPLLGREAKRG